MRSAIGRPSAYLGDAMLRPEGREGALRRALGDAVRDLPASGAALVRPVAGGELAWRISYSGDRERRTRRWLEDRLRHAPADPAPVLEDTPHPELGLPALFPLGPAPGPGGLLVLWRSGVAGAFSDEVVEGLRSGLEALLEVERAEGTYFLDPSDPLGPELSRALRGGDEQGLPALLTMARMVGGSDFAYWGGVHDGVVDIEQHLGARSSGFGFELPLGHGVGGSAFARAEMIEVPDYLNCRYRYPGVSDVTDREGVRSTLAMPVRGLRPGHGGVLYAVRRRVAPFTDAQRALLLRLKRSVEPSPDEDPPHRPVFFPGAGEGPRGKAELRRVLLHSAEVRDVEAWLEREVRGTAVSVDRDGNPFVLSNAAKLERLRSTGETPAAVPLDGPGEKTGRGRLFLWSSSGLPKGWPDLLEDAATALSVVADRAEQAREGLGRQRSQWLRDVSGGPAGPALLREGDRLGLPTGRGEVWAFAWEGGIPGDSAGVRLKVLAEDVVLNSLGAPLTVMDDVGVILLRDEPRERPSAVRDALLRYLGPAPLWLAHGAGYDSFDGLRAALDRAVQAAREARDARDGRPVVEVNSRGLDALLDNPKLGEHLSAFADDILGPLLDHDEETGSSLAETLCCVLASGSTAEAAGRLFVHENTVRYRLRRARQLLECDLDSPKDRTAISLAAFVRLRRGQGAS